jgi:hypothetical protein
LTIEKDASSPYYLLMWEKDWQALSTTSDQRIEYLVTSEGKGPDKKNRLVLAALIPGRDSPQQKNGIAEQQTSTEAAPDAATAPVDTKHAAETPSTVFSQQEAPAVKPETGEPPAPSPATNATAAQEETVPLQTAPSLPAQGQESTQQGVAPPQKAKQ